jgi:hypothetical protein
MPINNNNRLLPALNLPDDTYFVPANTLIIAIIWFWVSLLYLMKTGFKAENTISRRITKNRRFIRAVQSSGRQSAPKIALTLRAQAFGHRFDKEYRGIL